MQDKELYRYLLGLAPPWTVEYVGDGRRKESLDGYFALLSKKACKKIEAIAVDIWDPYLASIREHVPEAEEKVVFDRYHLMVHMVKSVNSLCMIFQIWHKYP